MLRYIKTYQTKNYLCYLDKPTLWLIFLWVVNFKNNFKKIKIYHLDVF